MRSYIFKMGDSFEIKEDVTNKSVLIQVFCGENKKAFKKILKMLSVKYPKAVIMGTSTDGEIYNFNVLEKNIVVSISVFDNTALKIAYSDKKDSFEDGKELAQNLVTSNTKLVIAFSDGINSNGEDFLKGFYSVAKNIKIAGGMAGDNGKLKKTFIAIGDKIYSSGAVAVSLNSDILEVTTLYNFGWQPIGVPFNITSSKKNRVYEIDNMRAIDFYKRYLGDEAMKFFPLIGIAFPLVFKEDDKYIARAVLKKHEDGSVSCGGNIPEGKKVFIGVGDKTEIISTPIPFKSINVESFFIYSCMARRRFLSDVIEDELHPFALLAPTSGFFTYGEFYTDKKPYLFNETLTAVALSEAKNKKSIPSDIKKKDSNIQTLALTHLLDTVVKDLADANNLKKEDFDFSQYLRLIQKGEMINMVAHQWRQPLNAINVAALKLELKAEVGEIDVEEIKKTAKFIESVAQEMSQMIDNFMDFTKPTERKECIEFSKIIKKILLLNNTQLKDHKINIEMDFDDIKVFTFPNELIHILIILISNAKDALDERNIKNKKILLKAYKNEMNFIIEVIDNGGGIPEEIKDKIFEQYFTTKEKGKGTGIGLFMSRRLLKIINGDIKVENVGNGAKFTVVLKDALC